MIFTARTPRRRKPERSAHQKQIRFLTGPILVVGLVMFAAVFWYFTYSGLIAGSPLPAERVDWQMAARVE